MPPYRPRKPLFCFQMELNEKPSSAMGREGFSLPIPRADFVGKPGMVGRIHRKLILLALVNGRGIQYNKLVKEGRTKAPTRME